MMRLLLMGFGVVGQGLARRLLQQAEALRARQGFVAGITAVVTGRHGTLAHPDGLEPGALLQAIEAGSLSHYPERPGLLRDQAPETLIDGGLADVLVEVSPTRLEDAQPALDYCRGALAAGLHLALANKGPLCLAAAELEALAQRAGRQLRYEAAVMAGTPALSLAREALAASGIREARGILNGTCNYILTQMEAGMGYGEALAQAQALGYAEADPRADVEGHDTAAKAVILAWALFGQSLRLDALEVRGIAGLAAADIEAARAAGERWKLVATVNADGARVEPLRLAAADPLATVGGVDNALTWSTEALQEVTLVGPGAGAAATSYGLLADLLAIQGRSAPG